MKQNELTDSNIKKLIVQDLANLFNVYTDNDGNYFYNLLKTVYFPEDLDLTLYEEYTVLPKDTWPTISWKFYQNVSLWWIVCAINNIQVSTSQPKAGTILKILNTSIVRDVLLEIRGN